MIFINAEAFKPLSKSSMYLYAGGKESQIHLPNVQRLESILRQKTNGGIHYDIKFSVNEEGEHGETYWKKEFPKAIKWLFYKTNK